MKIHQQCEDVMESINPEATRPFHYRKRPYCGPTTTKVPAGELQKDCVYYTFCTYKNYISV